MNEYFGGNTMKMIDDMQMIHSNKEKTKHIDAV
jgi:hypothetical protein